MKIMKIIKIIKIILSILWLLLCLVVIVPQYKQLDTASKIVYLFMFIFPFAIYSLISSIINKIKSIYKRSIEKRVCKSKTDNIIEIEQEKPIVNVPAETLIVEELPIDNVIEIEEKKPIVNAPTETLIVEKQQPIAISKITPFPKRFEDYILKYDYYDVRVSCSNMFDISNVNLGNELKIIKEPTNQYDPNALAIICNNKKIGYIPKNRLQSMYYDFEDNGGIIKAYVSQINGDNVIMAIGYYSNKQITNSDDMVFSDDEEQKTIKLIGNKNKDMQKNILNCLEGEEVIFVYNDKLEKLVAICNDNEIGYVTKASQKYLDNLDDYTAYLDEIIENDNGIYSVEIVIDEY
ncbi:MAG: hypothetical protein RSD67_05485 [Oscillospiraceae bacterium]